MGLELGGNVAQRIGKLCYVKISASTILNLVIKCPIPAIKLPKIFGVDDWAFKKCQKYGTIIVDLEKNEVIDFYLIGSLTGGVPQRSLLGYNFILPLKQSVEIALQLMRVPLPKRIIKSGKRAAFRWQIAGIF
jgi:hypothetical protein